MIITISREFGSGGRELGKRLSDELHIPCYDNEIIEMISKEHGLDADYVAHVSESSLRAAYPLTIGRRFAVPHKAMEQSVMVAVTQQKIIQNLAQQGGCVIVGRCADSVLAHLHPFRIFVYAEHASKLKRCQERAKEQEKLTLAEMERRMRQIDKNRARKHELTSNTAWGAKEGYDLCINTSGREIKTLVPALAGYIRCWVQANEDETGGDPFYGQL